MVKKSILLLIVLLCGYFLWIAFWPSNEAEYMRRFVAWNESDILDHEKFPFIEIENEGPVWTLPVAETEVELNPISYTIKGKKLTQDINQLNDTLQTTSFIIIRNDTVIFEKYYNGYERNTISTSFSDSKSFTSVLVGLALDKGFIGSLEDKVTDYLPEYRPNGFHHLTIRDLLVMASGIDYRTTKKPLIGNQALWWDHNPRVYYYPDLRELIKNEAIADTTIINDYYFYNDYHPVLLGLILEKATGKSPAKLMEEWVWKPSGMEFPASWSIDSEKSGVVKMESGLNARSIDFARFGLMVLHDGYRDSTEIISTDWLKLSTLEDPNDNRPWGSTPEKKAMGVYYKYMWWGENRADAPDYFMASGHLGQYIVIFPEKNLVIVRNGKSRSGVDWWPDIFVQIAQQL